MPYLTNADLPASIRHSLPQHARLLFCAAFNAAFEAHASDPRREQTARRIAWAAVKRSYVKRGDLWVSKALERFRRSLSS